MAAKTFLDDIQFKQMQERGGINSLKKFTSNIDINNFDSYIESFRKSNLLINLVDNGFNVTKQITHKGKKMVPLELFKKEQWDSESISRWYETLIDESSINVNNKILEESTDFLLGEEFFERLATGEDKGSPFEVFPVYPGMRMDEYRDPSGKQIEANKCLAYFSKQINGIPNGLTMICGYSNVGKTTLVIQILLSLLQDENERIMIITNEQRKKDFELSFLTLFIFTFYKYFGGDPQERRTALNITKSKIKNFDLTPEELKICQSKRKLFDELLGHRIEFVSLEDSDVALATKKMRVAIASRGVTTCVYDTFKCDFSDTRSDNSAPEYIKLIKDSRKFESLARRFGNVKIICTVQLAISTQGTLFPDASVLSNSKQIKEVCDLMIIVRGTYQEELDVNNKTYYCHPYRSEFNPQTQKWEVNNQPDLGTNKIYRTVFIEKSRNSGNVSSDTGIAYLFTFDGSHGFWKDAFKCRPVHGHINRKS